MVDWLEILKTIWDIIKGTDKILKPEDDSILKNKDIRKQFLSNNKDAVIFNVHGDLYIGDYSQLPSLDKEKLLKQFKSDNQDKSDRKINVIESEFLERVEDFRQGYTKNRRISNIINYLEQDLKNILNLSMYVKYLFDNSKSNEALRVKEDIGNHYGKEGRKLCNLYLSGYIDGMVEYLEVLYDDSPENLQKEINDKIKDFVKRSDYIFFIHSRSIEEEIVIDIKRWIKLKQLYIAIHGAGSNIQKVKIIIERVKEEIVRDGYDINEEKLKTLSKCPLLNVYITKR